MQPTLCRALSLVAATCFSLAALAQPAAPPAPSDKPLAFEVVSIRQSKSGLPASIQSPPNGDSIVITNMTPRLLIGFAYDLPLHDEIYGLPAWADSESFDITAKVAASNLPAFHQLLPCQRNPMLRPLLADRFHLQDHYENRSIPAYVLVLAKKGPKLAATTNRDTGPGGIRMNRGQLTGDHASIAPLVDALSLQLDRPVVDRTGLTGRYDFTLNFAPAQASTDPQADSNASIFTAVQDQLGLKLEPAKAPVPVLVIDHIEKPSPN